MKRIKLKKPHPNRAVRRKWKAPKPIDLIDDFVYELTQGATEKEACAIIGLSLNTYRAWMRRGRAYRELMDASNGDWEHNGDLSYHDFLIAVERAQALYRKPFRMYLNNISGMDARVGQVCIEVLGRRDPENWGRDRVATGSSLEEFSADDSFL